MIVGSAVERSPRPLEGQVFLITGGRRGIGEKITLGLAELGASVAVSYVSDEPNKAKRSRALEEKLENLGVKYNVVRADVSTREGRAELIDAGVKLSIGLNGEFKGFRGVVLNAAAGLEEGGREYYARQVNFEGNKTLVEETAGLMAEDSDYEFIQSLWGHQDRPADFNGQQRARLLPFYGLIARTKFDFETWIRREIPALGEKRIGVNVGVGYVIEGTGAFIMLKKYFPDRLDVLRMTVQGEQFQTDKGPRFPNADEMAQGAIGVFLVPFEQKRNGHTVYVGGNQAEPADPKMFLPYDYSRDQIAGVLPMYDETTLYLDRFVSGEDKMRGRSELTIRDIDVRGHFAGPFEYIKLYRGVLIPEMGAQTLAMIFAGMEQQEDIPLKRRMVGYFDTVPETKVDKMVLPGDRLVCEAEVTAISGRNFKGRATFSVGDEIIAEPKNFILGIAPYVAILELYNKTVERRKKLRGKA